MKEGNDSRIIRFGPFEADLETGELRKAGAKLPLQVQPFQVLAFFLEHPGELLQIGPMLPEMFQQLVVARVAAAPRDNDDGCEYYEPSNAPHPHPALTNKRRATIS